MRCHSFIVFFSLARLVLSLEGKKPGLDRNHNSQPSRAMLTFSKSSLIVLAATVATKLILHPGHLAMAQIYSHLTERINLIQGDRHHLVMGSPRAIPLAPASLLRLTHQRPTLRIVAPVMVQSRASRCFRPLCRTTRQRPPRAEYRPLLRIRRLVMPRSIARRTPAGRAEPGQAPPGQTQ